MKAPYDLGVPLPKKTTNKGRQNDYYYFDEMPVGASLARDAADGGGDRLRLAAAKHRQRYPKWDYVTHRQVESGVLVVRLWRTA